MSYQDYQSYQRVIRVITGLLELSELLGLFTLVDKYISMVLSGVRHEHRHNLRVIIRMNINIHDQGYQGY